MSYLEVGEDMHKLASHVVDSVSWSKVLSSKSGRGGDLRSYPYRPQQMTNWTPKMMGFS